MEKEIKGVGKKIAEVKGEAIDGFNLTFHSIADAVNTTPNGIDLAEVRIKCTLMQVGLKEEIVNTTILPLAFDALVTSPNGNGAQNMLPSTAGILTGFETVSADASTKGEKKAVIPIRFGGGIILKGNDQLKIEITVSGSAWDANCDADSYIYLETNQAQVEQHYVPYIDVETIPTNENSWTETIGDNVQSVSLINVDKNCLDANAPVTEIEFTSNKLDFNRTFTTHSLLYQYRTDYFSNRACAELVRNSDLDDVNIKLTLNSANVNSDMNYIVIRHFDPDRDLSEQQIKRTAKHNRRALVKFGR